MKTKLFKTYESAVSQLRRLSDLPLLFMRLVLAYGFWGTGMMKWKNIDGVAEWFGSMGIPFPTLNAYLAATTEIVGVIFLILGLTIRIISLPLMFVMLVAIFTVHLHNGFEAGNNGFEIPLYYLIMLFTLFIYGGGKISLDNLLRKTSLA